MNRQPQRPPTVQPSPADLISRVLRVQVLDVEDFVGPPPPTALSPAEVPATMANLDLSRPSHSEDFETVVWNRRVYFLSPNQRVIVRALWQAWEKGHPYLDGAGLLELVGCESKKVSQVFKRSEAWMNLIAPGELHEGGDGTYCLVPLKA